MVELAKRYGVIEMALFGSVLGPDLGPDSDIDVLVDIDEGARISLWDFVRLKNELSDLVGREVDLVPKKQLKPFVRDEVLSSMRVVYAAT
jgi:predicted nucleotidyltransferase